MYISRDKIRKFLDAVEWITARNIIILSQGKYAWEGSAAIRNELYKMANAVTPEKRIKHLSNQAGNAVFAPWDSPRSDAGSQHFVHDNQLRDCLAKWLHDRDYAGMEELSIKTFADAKLGDIYFEFDNGHMTGDQLKDKLSRHYKGRGRFIVVFFMGHRYRDPHGEKLRLNKLFDIVREVLPHKPGRVFAACYSEFIEDGIVRDGRGAELNQP